MSQPPRIEFCSPRNAYGWMSNFSNDPVQYFAWTFPTSEHLYQALKFHDMELFEKIRLAWTPKDAALLGRSLKPIRSDWDEIKVPVMKTVLRLKLCSNPPLITELLLTGDAQLVEYSKKDYFWGCGEDRTGQNMLGKLWMELRTELQ
jgi:ribA/ribD-fused uncharacterized protein